MELAGLQAGAKIFVGRPSEAGSIPNPAEDHNRGVRTATTLTI
jgi:hypothetical protein